MVLRKKHSTNMPAIAIKNSATSAATAVRAALADKKYDFRTVAGLARSTKLSKEEVSEALKNLGDVVRVSNVTDAKGNLLFTLRNKDRSLKERISELRAFAASSSMSGIL